MSFSSRLKEELSVVLQNKGISASKPNDTETIFEIFNNAKAERDLSVRQVLYANFLSKVFIKCGNITNPEVKYHLEFNLSPKDKFLCDAIVYTFEDVKALGFLPSITRRRGNLVIYLKDSEKITDFLVFIGAQNAAMEIMQIKMIKEVRNNINRSTNFETANLSKVTNSSAKHIDAINKIKNSIGIEELPEHLRETALLRIMNPYISLNDLSKLYEKPISKSGINHRLKKIMDIAKEIK